MASGLYATPRPGPGRNPPPLIGNLITNPNDLSQGSWNSILFMTRTGNAALAPDGTTTASYCNPSGGSANNHNVGQTGLTVTAQNYICRARFKPAGYSGIYNGASSMDAVSFTFNNSTFSNFVGGGNVLATAPATTDVFTPNYFYTGPTPSGVGAYKGLSRQYPIENGWTLYESITTTFTGADSTHQFNFFFGGGTFSTDTTRGWLVWGVEVAPVTSNIFQFQ